MYPIAAESLPEGHCRAAGEGLSLSGNQFGVFVIHKPCSLQHEPHRPLRPRQPRAQLSAAPDHIPQRPLEILHPQLGPAPLQHRLRRAAVEFLDESGAHLADAPGAADERGLEHLGTPGRLVVSRNSTRASGRLYHPQFGDYNPRNGTS